MVLENFKRVFRAWAAAADVSEAVFYDHWRLDDAYKAQEVGELSFTSYCEHLSTTLNVTMTDQQWRDGWNALWTHPFKEVCSMLPAIGARYSLYAFSNTNAVHANSFFSRYPEELAHFNKVFLSHEIGLRKPSVEAFKQVCERMALAPEDVFFIDDTPENVEGAKKAGLNAHHARGGPAVAACLAQLL